MYYDLQNSNPKFVFIGRHREIPIIRDKKDIVIIALCNEGKHGKLKGLGEEELERVVFWPKETFTNLEDPNNQGKNEHPVIQKRVKRYIYYEHRIIVTSG